MNWLRLFIFFLVPSPNWAQEQINSKEPGVYMERQIAYTINFHGNDDFWKGG